ncbi:MAG: hypothetical protein R3D52_11395 [Xanthobacteraceae bacterium]
MPPEEKANTVREAVGAFSTPETLQEAIDELMSSGFDRADLSMLAAEGTVDQKLGHRYRKIAELEDDPIVPRCCYVSTEAIGDAQGWLVGGLMYVGATAASGAVVATGGTLAPSLSPPCAGRGRWQPRLFWLNGRRSHAKCLREQLDHGGLLLWVRAWDAGRRKSAPGRYYFPSIPVATHIHTLPVPG